MSLAEPVVTTLVCFLQSAHGAAGAVGARLSLRPLFERGTTNLQNSGKSRRGNESVCLHVIASEATLLRLLRKLRSVQSPPKRPGAKAEAIHRSFTGKVDCFVSGACHRARIRATRWLLAMTAPGEGYRSIHSSPQPSSPRKSGEREGEIASAYPSASPVAASSSRDRLRGAQTLIVVMPISRAGFRLTPRSSR